jgi:hypothetical protein
MESVDPIWSDNKRLIGMKMTFGDPLTSGPFAQERVGWHCPLRLTQQPDESRLPEVLVSNPNATKGFGSHAMQRSASRCKKNEYTSSAGPMSTAALIGSRRYGSKRISGSPKCTAYHAFHFSSMPCAPASGKLRFRTRLTCSIALFICAK